MTKLVALALLVAALALGSTSSGAARQSEAVDVVVAVPGAYTSTVTPAQAEAAVDIWMAAINDWFRDELGRVVNYEVSTVAVGDLGWDAVDACGSFRGVGLYGVVTDRIKQASNIGFGRQDRTMILLMGAGGWAGHFAPTDNQVPHFGMVGDWGVMEQYDARVSCIPEWDQPNRGFSHEFAGMMGMYVGGGCYQDGQGCFVGDPLSDVEVAALLKYSGRWLRSP